MKKQLLIFRALKEKCGGISATILNQRLGELRETGITDLPENQGYSLTPQGIDLFTDLAPLNQWAEAWKKKLEP